MLKRDTAIRSKATRGAESDRRATLTNPAPHPDPAKPREEHLGKYAPKRADWQALTPTMHRTVSLPGDEVARRVLIRTAIGLNSHYEFRLPGQGKADRTLLLRLSSLSQKDRVQAEVVDARTNQPLHPGTPTWNGTLDSRGLARIHFGGSGGSEPAWDFAIGSDDQPIIVCETAGQSGAAFPISNIPLLPIASPHYWKPYRSLKVFQQSKLHPISSR